MDGSFLFTFEPHVPLVDAEMSLHLAMFAVEGLAGRAQVRLNASYQIDAASRAIRIDGSTRVGQMIARVFTGFLLREYGEDAFCVEHVTTQTNPQLQEVNA